MPATAPPADGAMSARGEASLRGPESRQTPAEAKPTPVFLRVGTDEPAVSQAGEVPSDAAKLAAEDAAPAADVGASDAPSAAPAGPGPRSATASVGTEDAAADSSSRVPLQPLQEVRFAAVENRFPLGETLEISDEPAAETADSIAAEPATATADSGASPAPPDSGPEAITEPVATPPRQPSREIESRVTSAPLVEPSPTVKPASAAPSAATTPARTSSPPPLDASLQQAIADVASQAGETAPVVDTTGMPVAAIEAEQPEEAPRAVETMPQLAVDVTAAASDAVSDEPKPSVSESTKPGPGVADAVVHDLFSLQPAPLRDEPRELAGAGERPPTAGAQAAFEDAQTPVAPGTLPDAAEELPTATRAQTEGDREAPAAPEAPSEMPAPTPDEPDEPQAARPTPSVPRFLKVEPRGDAAPERHNAGERRKS
jgi:hypothetical protein